MLKKIIFLSGIFMLMTSGAQAAIKTSLVEYSSNGEVMEGYVAYDDQNKIPMSAILVVPDWMGMSPFAKSKAEQLAKEGYVAFAVDVYGKGVRPANADEAGKLAGKYKGDRPLLRAHMKAAYDTLAAMPQVNPTKILVMGYCFGGTSALELARSGAPLAGTATFHGGLSNPTPEDAKNIKGPVLVMHGADDPFVPPPEVQAFKDEMAKANIKLTFVSYPGAVHAFAVPTAGSDKTKGAAYDPEADKESWDEFERFLKQTL